MSFRETTTPAIEQEAGFGPPDVMNPNNFEVVLTDDLITELIQTSLGYGVNESAQVQGLTTDEVNRRRSSAKGYLRARNRRHMVAVAIQKGLVPLEIEANPSPSVLTTGQEDVLRLLALGWSSSEIQARYGITESTVDSRLVRIKEVLGSRNPHHTIRRAFELGIFKIDEQILDPDALRDARDEAQDIRNGHLLVGVEDTTLTAREIGLNTQNELDIVRILGGLGVGYFNGASMLDNGFSPNSPSMHTRFNLYGVAAKKVEHKLNNSFNETILSSHAQSRNYRYYYVVKQMAIGTLENMQIVKPVGIDELPKAGSNRIGVPINRPKRVVSSRPTDKPKQPARAKPAEREPEPNAAIKQALIKMEHAVEDIIRSTPTLIKNPYMDQNSLPELNDDLLKSLVPRPQAELSTNRSILPAIKEIMQSKRAPFDYRERIVASLRFGVPVLQPVVISRGDLTMRLDEIMEAIPSEVGIDVASTSLVTGLKPEAILETELVFLNKHKSQFPQLEPLIKIVARDLVELRKTKSSN